MTVSFLEAAFQILRMKLFDLDIFLETSCLIPELGGAIYSLEWKEVLWDKLDLSRFDAAPLIAFIATKEMSYGNEANG